jgi:hypothetical protein
VVRGLPNLVCVRGNTTPATLGVVDLHTSTMKPDLAISCRSAKSPRLTRTFCYGCRVTIKKRSPVHGSQRKPVWDYVMDYLTALRMFHSFDTQI